MKKASIISLSALQLLIFFSFNFAQDKPGPALQSHSQAKQVLDGAINALGGIENLRRAGKITINYKAVNHPPGQNAAFTAPQADFERQGSWFVEITPGERKIYTPNLEGKSVSVIDRATGKVKIIQFEYPVYGIDITPDGKQVWVSGGDLFRIALRKDKAQEVSLLEELEFLKAFLQKGWKICPL